MQKSFIITGIGGVIVLALLFNACNDTTKTPGTSNGSDSTKIITSLSDTLPYNVVILPTDSVLDTQIRHDFDLFSWQSFIALNWPLNKQNVIGQQGDNNTVWETWKENYQVFLPDGSKPDPWDAAKQGKEKLLVQVGKTPTVLTDVTQPFLTGPLIDQNGQYTRFQIVMNEEMFDYIDTNTLYNYQGQLRFDKTIDFPGGDNPTKKYGAIMVKASWKILGKGDDTSRFHKANATIHVPAIPGRGIHDTTYKALVGLVGLHIGTKSKTNPQWIWSTFEQVDNAPTFGQIGDVHYNFYNKQASDRKVNNKPDEPWDPNRPGQVPSQIVRLTPVFSGTQALNDFFHKQLAAINPKSVWQYYELVGTQWPVHARQLPAGDPFPVFMANATLESYIQGTVRDGKVVYTQGVTSSCIGCHNGATTLGGKASDFTYLLRTAAATPKKKTP
ncbi:hypothetical protein [Mucilaginibacter xinganensis]|uniref:Uncharacterized protein n=1 Tax=Mucilaginibacter xinganensis TaxID=1234841 RepID=A0A223NY93_9SPHI|nr:hypothetical protein [Mucilaginibacter xinganensis]ASU34568.1 hypothetical protein MuYL_2681 [Mucilaginibacter xinganensis]